uniref:Putative methyltransferase n=1 Tax=viral metagenome TaxID=1070528 RepID=A0A6M3L935_9ZZZZ
MHKKLINEYVCPYTRESMLLEEGVYEGINLQRGQFVSPSGLSFTIEDSIPVFLDIARLGELEKKTQSEYDLMADEIYDNAVDWLFESFYEDENKIRESMIDLLNLHPKSCVLEVGCGTGRDSFRIGRRLGVGGVLFLQDFSRNMVIKAKKTIDFHHKEHRKKYETHYFISDALYLPFPDDFFDAVFHFGGFNNFSKPEESLNEFARITKKGGKIVIGDESVPPWLERSTFGKIICANNSLFHHKVPLHAIPECARDVTVRWILGGCFYLIDFYIDQGTPPLNLDLPHKGRRGGTMRTRYYGRLEGVSIDAKKMAEKMAIKQGISLHDWLDRIIRKAAE